MFVLFNLLLALFGICKDIWQLDRQLSTQIYNRIFVFVPSSQNMPKILLNDNIYNFKFCSQFQTIFPSILAYYILKIFPTYAYSNLSTFIWQITFTTISSSSIGIPNKLFISKTSFLFENNRHIYYRTKYLSLILKYQIPYSREH